MLAGTLETSSVRNYIPHTIERWFPTPRMLVPQAGGLDISDSSVKWLVLSPGKEGFTVGSFAQGPLAPNIVVNGVVKDPVGLGAALAELRANIHADPYAHVALPEEAAYVFAMHVPNAWDRPQVHNLIEFEFEGRVPLKPSQTIYDFDVVEWHADGLGAEIAVSVFPRDIVEGYATACSLAGIELSSLELEARSIGRSIVSPGVKGVSLVVDFGRARTGIAILKGQTPIFTSTVAVGGDTISKILMDALKIDEEKAEEFKNTQGLVADHKDQKISEVISGTAAALADEIRRHYEYWDTRRNEHGDRVTPVDSILLTGGSSNLRGLDSYIAGRVKARTLKADVWGNVCSFDSYIPSIDRHHALGLSTVIGLALRSV
jgi:type IV pilus assembly protein PilM